MDMHLLLRMQICQGRSFIKRMVVYKVHSLVKNKLGTIAVIQQQLSLV